VIGIVDGDLLAVAQPDAIFDGGCRAEQREVELALEALLNDLHVEQPEEATAEAKAERGRRLRLIDQRGIVELEFLQRLLELLILLGIGREEAGEHHRRDVPVSGQRRRRRPRLVRNRVADARVTHIANIRDQVADLAGGEVVDRGPFRAEDADLVDLERVPRLHHLDAHARPQRSLQHTDIGDDAAVGVKLGVEDQRM